MVLAASLEFERSHNKEVQERQSDNVEIPQVRFHSFKITFKSVRNIHATYVNNVFPSVLTHS